MQTWIKFLWLLVVASIDILPCYSQTIEVADFKKSKRIWPFRKTYPADKKYAWLDFQTSEEGFVFWANGNVPVEPQTNDGCLTLHLPHQTNFIVIRHYKFGQYTWKVPGKPLKKKKHYYASLITYEKEETYQLKKQWVSFDVSPSNAWLYVDSTRFVTRTGIVDLFLPLGKHHYRIESPFYEAVEDTFLLTDTAKVKIPVEMCPVYSYLTVTTPLKNAEIWVDGCCVGKGEGTSQRLMEGEHNLVIIQNDVIYYQNNVSVSQSEKRHIHIGKEDLNPISIFKTEGKLSGRISSNPKQTECISAPVTIYASEGNEEILINREVMGLGQWNGNLPIGKYAVQSRKEMLESPIVWLYVSDSHSQELWLSNHYISYGLLSVHCNVPDAEIWINGEMVGKTPAVLDALPADKPLELELKKTGYKTFHKQIVLTKNNLLEVDFILNKKR